MHLNGPPWLGGRAKKCEFSHLPVMMGFIFGPISKAGFGGQRSTTTFFFYLWEINSLRERRMFFPLLSESEPQAYSTLYASITPPPQPLTQPKVKADIMAGGERKVKENVFAKQFRRIWGGSRKGWAPFCHEYSKISNVSNVRA